jgi:heat shock protein HslJ
MHAVLSVGLLALLVGACSSGSSPNPFVLEGVLWSAVSVARMTPPPDHVPTLQFLGGRISGSSGCNSYGGGARIVDSRLVTEPLVMTARACIDETANQIESAFIGILQSRPLIGPRGRQLVIAGSGGEIVFDVAQQPPPTD